jgi:hypothetical protein
MSDVGSDIGCASDRVTIGRLQLISKYTLGKRRRLRGRFGTNIVGYELCLNAVAAPHPQKSPTVGVIERGLAYATGHSVGFLKPTGFNRKATA